MFFWADNYFSNGAGNAYNPTTYATTNPIAGTQDDQLYQTERASQDDNGSFSYNLPLASGAYTVVLHFAEIYWQNPGQRVFDVALEGSLVLDNYDIVKKTGAGFTATTESFVVNVTDGTLNLLFSALASAGGVNRPKIAAIEVIPYSGNAQARKDLSGTTPTGQLKASMDLSAYPNPFRQEINLKLEGAPAGAYTLRVLDLTGKSHYQTTFKLDPAAGTVQTLQLTDQLLPSRGLYLLEVNQVDGPLRKVIRMIKE